MSGVTPWIIVISAPSGAGKTTLSEEILRSVPRLKRAITTTTRPQRDEEKDGVSYHFVSRSQFEQMIRLGAFYEYADVHGNLYGTSRAAVEEVFKGGHHCLLIIDVQGARTMRQSYPKTFSIFIEPPSLEELERRLLRRSSEGARELQVRLSNARKELAEKKNYDVVVVNDDFDRALKEVTKVIEGKLDGC